jgi:hypothetical protein
MILLGFFRLGRGPNVALALSLFIMPPLGHRQSSVVSGVQWQTAKQRPTGNDPQLDA